MKRFLLFCLLFLSTNYSFALTHAEYFDKYLEPVSVMLEAINYKGPISACLAQRALGRQVLEDGISRLPNISMAGISTGSPNKEAVNEVLNGTNIKLGTASDSGGGKFYSFSGDFANVYSALVIAKLFDSYVPRFLKKENKNWILAKETSKGIYQEPDSFELNHRFYVLLQPEKIVEKSCRCYGPKSSAVTDILKRSIK